MSSKKQPEGPPPLSFQLPPLEPPPPPISKDPYHNKTLSELFQEELSKDVPSVIIKKQPSGHPPKKTKPTKSLGHRNIKPYKKRITRNSNKHLISITKKFKPFDEEHKYIYKDTSDKYNYIKKDRVGLHFRSENGEELTFPNDIEAHLIMKQEAWVGGTSIKKRTEKKTTRKK